MPRRLIIIILIVLILGIIAGTAFLVISRLRQSSSKETPNTPSGTLQEAGTGNQTVTDPTADGDNDGLNNGEESTWGTDPKNADTDGDSYLDGEEVKAQHNPTIPAPDDKLPEGFIPGKNIVPLTEAPSEPIAVDQFFADNLDLSGGNKNLTEEYNKAYPDAAKSPTTLANFVDAQPIVTKLPTPKESVIVTQNETGREALVGYVASLNDFKPLNNKAIMQIALQDLYTNNDPSSIEGMALSVHYYQEQLLRQTVPAPAANLHKLLLGYTQLLEATFDQIALWNEDRVKALVGIRQLAEIDQTYYPLLIQETAKFASSPIQ